MKKYTNAMLGLLIVTLAVFASAQVSRTITVTGTVQDSATGQPVAGAKLLLLDTTMLTLDQITGILANLGNLDFDTATTDADGKISFQMSVSTGSFVLGYGILKQGYQVFYSLALISPLSATVDLGTIKIAKSTALDTLTVSGKVVDSVTGTPLGGALVVMSGLGAFDTSGNNRVLTSTDGSFSKQVIITRLNNASVVGYLVSQLTYTPKFGQVTATGKSVDLGTIRLSKSNNAVLPGQLRSLAKDRSDGMSVYLLNGRLLYDGPVMAVEKISQCGSGAVMVTMKRNKAVVESRKVCLTR